MSSYVYVSLEHFVLWCDIIFTELCLIISSMMISNDARIATKSVCDEGDRYFICERCGKIL